MHYFLAIGGQKVAAQALDANEEIEIHLLDLEEVKRMLKKGEIMQSMHATALFHALEKLGYLQY